jgi:hypothetical protein
VEDAAERAPEEEVRHWREGVGPAKEAGLERSWIDGMEIAEELLTPGELGKTGANVGRIGGG